MDLPSSFERDADDPRAAGFDEVIERRWTPHPVLDTHTRPFDAQAVVVQGERWLACGDETRHRLPGDAFHLRADVPHAERYGAEGATDRVARRNQRS